MNIITRAEAQAQGLTHYFTGKPCKHGHTEKRFTSTGQCFVCLRNHDTAYRADPLNPRTQKMRENQNRRMKEDPKFVAARRAASRKHAESYKQVHGMGRTTAYYHSDTQFRIAHACRTRIRKMVRLHGGSKSALFAQLVGCTVPDLMDHLAGLFTDGMTWENHGEWHIDHIRPCASFDLTDPEQQRQCFHFSNLQPLWAEDNLRKSGKWEPARMAA